MPRWKRWTVIVLATVVAGWMLYDGTRALIVGDYTTAASGTYAGKLGPWSGVVEAVGIAPRSTGMKAFFVLYGLAGLAVTAAFVAGLRVRRAMLAAAVGCLWFLPFGTISGIAQIILLARTKEE